MLAQPVAQFTELRLFLFREAGSFPLYILFAGGFHSVDEGFSLRGKIHPLDPAVRLVHGTGNHAFFLRTGQHFAEGGGTQVQDFTQIPGRDIRIFGNACQQTACASAYRAARMTRTGETFAVPRISGKRRSRRRRGRRAPPHCAGKLQNSQDHIVFFIHIS